MELKKILPPFIVNIPELSELLDAEQPEFDALEALVAKTTNELNFMLADDYIARYEAIFAISNQQATLIERREFLRAKMASRGTATKAFIKSIAMQFNCGDIEVVEKFSEYQIEIFFASIHGIPSNLDNFKTALRAIIPAHLEILYRFRYMTWAEHDSYNKTWQMWDDLNLNWTEREEYGGN